MQLEPRGPGTHTWTAPQQATWPYPALQALLGFLPAPSWWSCQAGMSFAQFSPTFPIWHRGDSERYCKGQCPLGNVDPYLSGGAAASQVQTWVCLCD